MGQNANPSSRAVVRRRSSAARTIGSKSFVIYRSHRLGPEPFERCGHGGWGGFQSSNPPPPAANVATAGLSPWLAFCAKVWAQSTAQKATV